MQMEDGLRCGDETGDTSDSGLRSGRVLDSYSLSNFAKTHSTVGGPSVRAATTRIPTVTDATGVTAGPRARINP